MVCKWKAATQHSAQLICTRLLLKTIQNSKRKITEEFIIKFELTERSTIQENLRDWWDDEHGTDLGLHYFNKEIYFHLNSDELSASCPTIMSTPCIFDRSDFVRRREEADYFIAMRFVSFAWQKYFAGINLLIYRNQAFISAILLINEFFVLGK